VSSEYSSVRRVPEYDDGTTEVDWRDWKVVRDIQDQGSCGSCYSFSTIAAAESAYAIMTGELYKLSE
jgi:C1A family cysteine protease